MNLKIENSVNIFKALADETRLKIIDAIIEEPKTVGQIVAYCISTNKVLDTMTLEEYKQYSELFEEDLYNEISLETCVSKRISEGGTSVESVEKQIKIAMESLEND